MLRDLRPADKSVEYPAAKRNVNEEEEREMLAMGNMPAMQQFVQQSHIGYRQPIGEQLHSMKKAAEDSIASQQSHLANINEALAEIEAHPHIYKTLEALRKLGVL